MGNADVHITNVASPRQASDNLLGATPGAVACVAVRHSTLRYAGAGFAASLLIVLAGGHIGTVRVTIPLTTWFGVLSPVGYRPGASMVPGLVLIAAIIGLVLLWLNLVRGTHPAAATEPRVWAIAGAWSLPLLLGPPLLSSDVYTYATQGLLVDRGLDPYSVGPSALGNVPAVGAVDPAWRSVPSPYGPLATWFQHFAVVIGGGDPLGAVIVFRLAAALCVVAIGVLAAALAGSRRIPALTLTVLNPLVLLQVLSAAHLEGLLCALLLAALLVWRRGNPVLGVVLACAAAAVKGPALVAVVAIVAWQATLRRRDRGRLVPFDGAREAAVAVGACVGLTMLVPHGWGWVSALNTPALNYTAGAPASLIGTLFRPIVQPASFDDLAMAGRTAALLAAGCIVVYLTATVRRRPLEATVGLGLLAIAFLSPVIYPWYLLWGVLCLAPVAKDRMRGLLVLACASGAILAVPGLPRLTADLIDTAFIGYVAVTVLDGLLARWNLRHSSRAAHEPSERPRPLTVSSDVARAHPSADQA
jgi:hypothetical protein